MSVKPTKPSDTAYLVSYQTYETWHQSIVIAGNPVRAKAKLDESLTGRDREGFRPESVLISGELREYVKDAERDGVARL